MKSKWKKASRHTKESNFVWNSSSKFLSVVVWIIDFDMRINAIKEK